mmetsp:Transcript_4882/g.10343  ORF Transcript_4882/g.10343 Transcript_4882/m.10343 type:complete len:87 (-) Transcript_4882:581-841(-)
MTSPSLHFLASATTSRPIHVIRGVHSTFWPGSTWKEVEKIAAKVSEGNVRLDEQRLCTAQILRGAGHFLHADEPDLLASILNSYLR